MCEIIEANLTPEEQANLITSYLSKIVDDCSFEILTEYVAGNDLQQAVFECIRNAAIVDLIKQNLSSVKLEIPT